MSQLSRLSNIVVSADPEDVPVVLRFSNWLAGEDDASDENAPSTRRVGSLVEAVSRGGWGPSPWPVHSGVLRNARHELLVEWFARAAWQYPEYAQLWLRDQDDNVFSLWMFRDGVLQRITPHPPSVEKEIIPEDEICRIRLGDGSDREFLADLVARQVPDSEALVAAIMRARFGRRARGLFEPRAVIAVDEVPADDPELVVWRRIGAGVVWVDANSVSFEASVFITISEEFRSRPAVQLLLQRLIAMATADGVGELVAAVPAHDGWLVHALNEAGFSQVAADSTLRFRKQL